MFMPSRHQLLFASAAFSTFFLTTAVQAAPSTQQPAVKNTAANKTETKIQNAPASSTTAPIAGILDGSNGETINVHGHHARMARVPNT